MWEARGGSLQHSPLCPSLAPPLGLGLLSFPWWSVLCYKIPFGSPFGSYICMKPLGDLKIWTLSILMTPHSSISIFWSQGKCLRAFLDWMSMNKWKLTIVILLVGSVADPRGDVQSVLDEISSPWNIMSAVWFYAWIQPSSLDAQIVVAAFYQLPLIY